jgi:hypothetical protein
MCTKTDKRVNFVNSVTMALAGIYKTRREAIRVSVIAQIQS